MSRVFVIAEAGVNHDGNLDRARDLVEAAARAGADAVKFQTYSADRLVRRSAPKAAYQIGHSSGETQYEMLRHLELPADSHIVLRDAAVSAGIEFMSTPFDHESLQFLVGTVGVQRIKLSSGDLTNLPLLHAAGRTRLPIILSTGMATMDDVRIGLGALAHGRAMVDCASLPSPGPVAFEAVMSGPAAEELLNGVTILQCTSEYPAPDNGANLLAMNALADRFGLPVGLSDHSLGMHLSVAAVALGATVVEKHLTLDTAAAGPDHRASMDAEDFGTLVEAIRSVERALGTGEKMPSRQEELTATLVRRGLYAARDLAAGDTVTADDIAILRPQNSVPPSRYWDLIGTTLTRSIAAGEDLVP